VRNLLVSGVRFWLQLERRVGDIEMFGETRIEGIKKSASTGRLKSLIVNNNVGCKNLRARGNRPDVNVVHGDNPGVLHNVLTNVRDVGLYRGGVAQHSNHVSQQHKRARRNERGNHERPDSVGLNETRQQNDSRRDDRRNGTKQITEHLEVGAAHTDRCRSPSAHHEQSRNVGEQARNTDHEHGNGEHLGSARAQQPADTLDSNKDRDAEQQETVDESAKNFRTGKTKSLPIRCGARGDSEGDKSYEQADEVGEHVSGIRKQSERAGDERANNLENEETADDGDGNEQTSAIGLTGPVIVVMSCRHTTSVWRTSDK